MKIQIASDLHLEFAENRKYLDDNPLVPKGDVLILAGDTVNEKDKEKVRKYYEKWEKEFDLILQIPGNHEYYFGTIDYAYPNYLKKIADNHVYCNNKVVIHKGVKFILSTLWSDVLYDYAFDVSTGLNDYKLIFAKDEYGQKTPITIEMTNKYHRISLDFIKEEVSKHFDGKIVVVTHHLPSYQFVHTDYDLSPLNSAYATNLDRFIRDNPQINLWIFGHSHERIDNVIGKTRCVSNALGYVFEGQEKGFKKDYTIKI